MLNGAQVAVEFTTPSAAAANVRALIDAGIPTVVGTTGWYEALPGIERQVKERKDKLVFDSLPDDPGHLITVKLSYGVFHLDFSTLHKI